MPKQTLYFHPVLKLGGLLAVSLASFVCFNLPLLLALYLGVSLVLYVVFSFSFFQFIRLQVPFLVFALGMIMVNGVSRPGEKWFSLLGMDFTKAGLAFGVALAVRALLLGLLTITFIYTTNPRELLVGLISSVRLSPRYAYSIMSGQQLLLNLPRQWDTIQAAQKMRGVAGAKMFFKSAFILLTQSVRRADQIAFSLASRGLTEDRHQNRTIWKEVSFQKRDLWLVLFTLSLCAVIIYFG